ncbi:Uncharacterised protein [Mycobacteroides abscessus subsp. abscessus]|nr:Uncharacterised protein [Mycobacteroides abscessus subsp. abscessus]
MGSGRGTFAFGRLGGMGCVRPPRRGRPGSTASARWGSCAPRTLSRTHNPCTGCFSRSGCVVRSFAEVVVPEVRCAADGVVCSVGCGARPRVLGAGWETSPRCGHGFKARGDVPRGRRAERDRRHESSRQAGLRVADALKCSEWYHLHHRDRPIVDRRPIREARPHDIP